MAIIENSVQIDRTPEEVFEDLTGLRSELKWNPDAQSMEKLTDGPIAVGTKFLAKWKQNQLVEVGCIRLERPRRPACSNGGPLAAVGVEVSLVQQGTGTQLSPWFDVRTRG